MYNPSKLSVLKSEATVQVGGRCQRPERGCSQSQHHEPPANGKENGNYYNGIYKVYFGVILG